MIETRTITTDLEIRSGNTQAIVTGYAYLYGSFSQDLGGFKEHILKGAALDSIQSDDVTAIYNHDPALLLGRISAGTLKVAEDSAGLHYEIKADRRVSFVNDLVVMMERGDIRHSSFGFRVYPNGDDWSHDSNGNLIRTVRHMQLDHVSPVCHPAYLSSGVSVEAA